MKKYKKFKIDEFDEEAVRTNTSSENLVEFSHRLCKCLDDNELNGSELVRKINETETDKKNRISKPSLSAYINGTQIPSVAKLINIAKALNVSTDYLLGLTGPNQKSTDEEIKITQKLTGLSDEAIDTLIYLNEIFGGDGNIDMINLLIETLYKNPDKKPILTCSPIIDLITRYFKFNPKTAKPFSITGEGNIIPHRPSMSLGIHYTNETLVSVENSMLESVFIVEIEKALIELKKEAELFDELVKPMQFPK